MKVLLAMIAGLALSGCGSSPPTRFYTLEPTTPQSRSKDPVATPIKVDAVHIPSTLDRKTIVRNENNYELHISSQDRWGADFGDMVRRVLTQDLDDRLPTGTVVSPNAPAPGNALGLVVDILSFEPNSSGDVVLDADWTVLEGSPARPAIRRSVKLSEPAGNSAGSQAAAMSRLIGRLADEVAGALRHEG